MRCSSARSFCLLLGFTVTTLFIGSMPAAASGNGRFSGSVPEGFETLISGREVVVDVYFGGEKRGEVRAVIAPGTLRFEDPRAVAALIPDVARPAKLEESLTGTLPSNPSLACGPGRQEGCGTLPSGRTGVILDEERFRADIFVSPDLLITPDPASADYLPPPEEEPSLISLVGATLSGSSRGNQDWHLQNRSLASLGSVRLRSDGSLSSGSGVTFDNLTIETDRRQWRYTGGIFWAPGAELIGRRRIVGIGVMTQLDTSRNKEALQGTPLPIFLQQPARVEVLVDGRILSSRIYPAGNRLVDTESLPNGSYDVLLRIEEDGRPAREEQRFFTKGAAMAPLGRPLLSAFAGMLTSSSQGLAPDSRTFFYEATGAYRLSPVLGMDAAIVGTQHKAILEGGATFHSRKVQVRIAALASSSADYGAILRLASVGQGPFSFSFDMRKLVTKDDRPLVPVSRSPATFSEDSKRPFSELGSYTQALSILSYRLGQANLRLTGVYRRSGSHKPSYSVGAAAELPVVRTGRWELVLQADARKSDRDFASFIGVRFLVNKGSLSFSGSGGVRHQSDHAGAARLVGEGQASWYRELSEHGQVAGDVAFGRDVDGSYGRASVLARSDLINGRADILQQFGSHRTTQYTATINGGVALASPGIALAGRDLNDAAVVVSVDGGETDQKFDILVDEAARGAISSGHAAMLFLKPYQVYEVRLRARGPGIAAFDAASRKVSLYPGNVSRLDWDVTPLFILFGRAIGADGKAVANSDISGAHAIGRTDGEGYFQIETNRKDQLRIPGHDGVGCVMAVPMATPTNGLVSGGDLICR